LEIKPLPRSSGFKFEDKITGGVVPRNYIPAVEEGVIDGLKHGPLGFPVVDISVALIDGSYHTVDSSDMAFRIAGRLGLVEGLAAKGHAAKAQVAPRPIGVLQGLQASRTPFSTRACSAAATAGLPRTASPSGWTIVASSIHSSIAAGTSPALIAAAKASASASGVSVDTARAY